MDTDVYKSHIEENKINTDECKLNTEASMINTDKISVLIFLTSMFKHSLSVFICVAIHSTETFGLICK